MAELTVAQIDRAGLLQALTAVNSADTFDNNGRVFLLVDNQNAGTIVVTIDVQQAVDGQDPASKTVSLLTTETKLIGPFPPEIYNDANEEVNVAYDITASVTAQAYRL